MSEIKNNEDSLVNILSKVNYDMKQNMIIGGPPPSLQYLVLSKIAISLWTVQIEDYYFGIVKKKDGFKVKTTEKKIFDLISHLNISKCHENYLKPVIKSIGKEIANNFFLKNFEYRHMKHKIRLYLTNLCWNQQGTINILKSAEKIITDKSLTTFMKYMIACDFCLKDKIFELKNALSEFETSLSHERWYFSLSGFWLSRMRDHQVEEHQVSQLFDLCRNELALQYFWENFSEVLWTDYSVSHASTIIQQPITKGATLNFALYFVKQLSQFKLEGLHMKNHLHVLHKLNSISKWSNVLPVSKYALELIKTRSMSESLEIIFYCSRQNLLDFEEFFTLWNGFALHFKRRLEQEIVRIYDEEIPKEWKIYERGIIAKSLLGVASSEDRKELIYSTKTMVCCQQLLCEKKSFERELLAEDELQSFDKFFDKLLDKHELHLFKERFFQARKINLCTFLVIDRNYKLLDKILIEFCGEESIKEFKKDNCRTILESVLERATEKKMKLLEIVDKFLSWCFDGNKMEIKECKALSFDLHTSSDIKNNFFIVVKRFRSLGFYKLVRKYWKWIYCINKRINPSNETFELCKRIAIATYEDEEIFLSLKNNRLRELQDVVLTSCLKQDEIEKLKDELLVIEEFSHQVGRLILQNNYTKVKVALSWRFSANENKINDFKIKFMNLCGSSLLFHFIECNDIEHVTPLLKWLNPSVESAKMFKENFITFVEDKKKSPVANLKHDSEALNEKETDWTILNQRICKTLDLLNLYAKENEETIEAAGQVSMKRKIAEKEEPVESGKRRNTSN